MPQSRDRDVNLNVHVHTDGEARLQSLITSFESLDSITSRNSNITRYWKSQEQLITSAKIALDKFRLSQDEASGVELVNNINALQASVRKFDLSSIGNGIKEVYKSAEQLTRGMHGIVDVSSFSTFYKAIDNIKADLPGAQSILDKWFASVDASKAVEQMNYYKNAFSDAQVHIANLQEQLLKFDGTDLGNALSQIADYEQQVAQLENRIEQLKFEFSQSGVDKFSSYLRSQNLISSNDMSALRDGLDISEWREGSETVRGFIDELVGKIREGTKDADTAIAEFKQKFHNVIDDSGGMSASDLQQITSAIEGMASSAREAGAATEGISAGGLRDLINMLKEGSTGIDFPDFSSFIDSLEKISNLNVDGGVDSVRRLIDAFKGDLTVTGNTLTKLGSGLSALTSDFEPAKLATLSSLKFEGLNSLKVSKASLNNLATYLPTISSVNMESLERLSKINFSNLTKDGGLNLSKSQLQGLATLANQADFSSVVSAIEQMASRIEELYGRISQSSETAANNLVGSDSKVARSISHQAGILKDYELKLKSLGDTSQNSKLEETNALLDGLKEKYRTTTLTFDEYDAKMAKVKDNLAEVGEQAQRTAKAQEEAAKAAAKAAKEAEAEAKKSQTLSQDPEKLDQYMTKFTALEANIRKQLASWTKAKYGVSAEDYKNLEGTANKLGEIRQQLSGMTASGADAAFNSLSTSAKQFGNNIKIAGENTLTLGDRLGIAIKKYATFFTGMSAIMKIVQYGKQAVNAITEIDYSMNQLEIVTRETNAALNDYADNIIRVADTTAGSITDLIDATTTYARLGNSLEDSAVLAELTQMLQNVGNIDASSAQNAITAILKAFDLQASDMEGVLDRMVKVGNNFPISVSQLAEGLNNASSILAVATNYQEDSIESFEKSAAMLTAANTTVQNVSKSSTALRTIIARLRKMDTELDELGEVMTAAQYDELTQALTEQNVALTDETGQLRDAYDILLDMSEAWQKMTANERSALAQTFGSTRNQNVFISLMENFKEASDAMTAMQNSENELKNANDIYLDSIKAHIQQFKNAFETMFYSDGMVKFVNGIIDAGKGLLQLIERIVNLINYLGGLKVILPVIGSMLSGLITAKVVSGVTKFFSNLKNLGALFTSLRTSIAGFTAGQNAANAAMSTGAKLASALSTALGAIGMAIAVANFVANIIEKISGSNAPDLAQTVDVSKIKSTNQEISEMYQRFVTLQNQTDLTEKEQQELDTITGKLAETLNNESIALKGAKQSMDEYKASVGEAVLNSQDLLISEASEEVERSEEALKRIATYTTTQLYANTVDAVQKAANLKLWDDQKQNLRGYFILDPDKIDREREALQEAGYDVIALGNDVAVSLGKIDATSTESVLGYVEALINIKQALSSAGISVSSELYKAVDRELNLFQEEYDNRIEALAVQAESVINKAFTQAIGSGVDTSDLDAVYNTVIEKASELVDKNDDIELSETELIDVVKSVLGGMEMFADYAFDGIVDGSETAEKAVKSLADTMSSIQDLIGDENIVDIVFRPKVDASELHNAGWDIESFDEIAQMRKEVEELGIDASQTVFGNIDLNNRQLLEWTDANLEKYRYAIESWGSDVEDYADTVSTVLGSLDTEHGIGIAFSPMLQTESGAVLLDAGTFNKYLDDLITQAEIDDGSWTNEELFALDATGIEENGLLIKGLIADIGETAEATSQAMHYLGNQGAIALAEDAANVKDLFIKTFSNEDNTIAINFTPVVIDEYGNEQTVLTPKELEAYAKEVIDGTREDDLNIMIGTKIEMDEGGAKEEAERIKGNLEAVLSTLDPDFDISNYENLVRTLTAVDTASNAATKALDNLNKKLKDPTYRQGMEARSDNFTKMMDLFDQGLIGDTDFQAYAEYYGLDLFKTVDGQEVAKTYEEISAELEALMPMVGAYYDENGKLATNAELAMINWLDAIDEAEDELINLDNAADGTFGDLISWNKETEELKFDPSILFDADKMKLLESQFGISIEHFVDLLNEYRAHSLDWQSFSNEDLKTALESSKLLENVGDKAVLHVSQLEEMLTALGLDYSLIQDVVARAMQLSDIDIGFNYDGTETVGQVSSDIDGLIAQLEQAGYDADVQAAYIAEALSNVNPEIQAEVVANLDPELGEKVSAAIEDQNIEASVNTDVTTDVDDGLETIQSIWVNVDGQTLSFTVEANGLSDINDQLAALDERFGNSFDISTKPKQTAFLGEYAQYVSGGNNSDTPTYEIVMKYKLDDSEFKPAVDEAMEYIRRRFGEVDDVEVDLNGEKAVVSTDKLSDYIESQSPEEHVEADVSDAAETTSGFRRNEESKAIHIPVTITPEQVQTDIEFNQPIDGTPDYYDPGVFDTPVESYSVSPTADEQSLSQLTSDIEGAISDADADITLPSLSELPKVPEYKMEMEEVAKSVDGVSESFDNVSSSVSDLNSQNVDTSRKVAAIDGLSQAAEDASDSEHGLIDTSKELSNTGIDVSGKTGQLSNLSGSARSTAGNIRQTTNEWYALRNSPDTINKTITTTYKTVQVRQQAAKGTRHAKGGTTLLGDEYNASGRPRPELVISDGEAYIAGMDGPTLANLKPGDVVFTYEDTKKILSGSGISGKFPAFAGGTIDYEKIYKNVLSKTGGAAASYTDNSTNYNTYNYNAGSDSSSSETEEEFDWVDWIEVILDRAERAVADFKKIAESTYNSLKKRLSATGNEIKAITNEIGLQERAYQRYLQQANAVGLSADLAQLVRDGTIDIRQYDEETRNLISDYQNWYEKALSCADAVAELHENLASLYEDNFNNIQTDYENQIERMSFLTNEYNKVTSVIARTQNNTIPTLRKELGSLEEAFAQAMKSGEIEEQSEAWYAMIGVIQDVRDKISEAYEGIFSDIEKKYDHQLQSLEHFTNEYTNAMDQIEEKGRLASTRFYSALSDIEKQNISLMTAELKELEDALSNAIKSGEIEVYSEAWYSMREAIDDVKESIGEANLQLLKYETSMRELDWSYFDYTRDRVSKLNEEAEFLIDLLSSNNLYQDNGQLNGEGLATLGLRVQNYDVDMAEADAYAEEIKKINRDIANDPYNTKLIERRDELLKLQRDSILAAENEKKAIKSLVEEGIKIELENLKELIDKYNDSLDSAKDLYEYNKNIAEQTKNISSLEKQLNAYQNDTSEETRARVQKLRVELDDARQKLEETQYDRFVSDSKKMLDNLYDEYSELLNSRLDDLDQLVTDMIDAVNKNSLDINSTIQSASEGVGYTTSNELNKIWNNANYVASFYGNDFSGKLTTVNETLGNIKTFVEALVKNSNKEAEKSISGTSASTAATNTATTTGGTTRALTPSVTPSATSASASSSQLSLSRNLSYGNTGDDVKQLQQKLYDLGYLNAAPDGIFGSYTLAAVNTFQMANGLNADGIVGQHTLAKLNGSPIKKQNAKTTTFSSSKNLSYNSHGSEVAQLQRRLAELGYYAGYIDGDFGSQTLQAVKDFQTANGIYADGIVGPVTTKALNGNPKLGKFMRYATGGLVTSTGFAQLDGTPQKPELVLNAEDTRNFIALKDILSDISSPLKLASMSGFSHLIGGQMGAGIGNVINGGININIDRVEDYNDFVNQLRQDHQFEKLIQSMTTDRMAGRSSLMKNNYRW